MSSKLNILRYLTKTNASGKQNELTTAQARAMFKVQHVAARIYDLRSEGFRIYTNNRRLKVYGKGSKERLIRIGRRTLKVLWRYSANPIIPRDLIPSSNSIFNSAAVPFNRKFAGILMLRCNIHP